MDKFSLRFRAIDRARVLELIGGSLEELPPLTLLHASSGAGKTSAAMQWAHLIAEQGGAEVAWVHAPGPEVDAGQLWSRAAAALGGTETGMTPGDARLTLDQTLSRLRQPTPLVIDDYQFVSSGELDMALARLLERSPMLHLIVLSTRFTALDGPLVSSRVGTNIITGEQLAFTEQECRELARSYDLPTSEAIERLWQQSRGWPLMVRSVLQRLSEGGDDRDISRTLIRFGRQHLAEIDVEGGRRALLATVLCPEISLEMLSQLMALTMSQTETLTRRLAELGLLTEHLWADTTRFCCHEGLLLALQAPAVQEFGDETRAIRQRHATDLGRDNPIEAVKQLLAIEDYEDASRLLTRYFLEIMRPGSNILERLRQVPDEAVQLHPALIAATLLLETPEADTPSERLEQLRQWLREAVRSRMLEGDFDQNTAVIASLSVAERMRGDVSETLRLAKDVEQRTSRLSENRLIQYRYTLPLIFSAIGFAGIMCDDLELAERGYRRAAELASRFGLTEEDLRGRNGLAAATALSGDLVQAARQLQDAGSLGALMEASAPGLSWLLAEMVRAILACERYDAEAAAGALAPALDYLGHIEQWPLMLITGAQAVWLSEGPVEALESLQRQKIEAAVGFPSTEPLRLKLTAFEARLCLAIGDYIGLDERLAALPGRHPEAVLVRALHALHIFNAGAALERVEALDSIELDHRQHAEQLLITAAAEWRTGREAAALESFSQACDSLRRYGLRLPLCSLPYELLEQLAVAADSSGSPAAVEVLEWVRAVPQPLRARSFEALSKAEQRTLEALESDRTIAEIAADLFLSANTVKFHLKSIYRKLAVPDRAAALKRARQMQLLG